MAQSEKGNRELIDEIFRLLEVRCRVKRGFVLQIRLKSDGVGVRYSYQFFSGTTTILRWDNAPHFPGFKNYPHHLHGAKGLPIPSVFIGNPLDDLPLVLTEVEKYFET